MEDSQVNLIFESAATLFGTVFHILGHLSKKEKDYPCSICCQQLRSATDISDDSWQAQTTRKSTNVAANIARKVSFLRFSFALCDSYEVMTTKNSLMSRPPNARAKYECQNK
ncbi:hypothetical protein CEXT_83491 [Caerostris extrusa]|uniref:Uncharacterized protein n=1 Tax=Caerostris extrusa TaxID=172846 RepID=A0AAV4Q9T6_CAEEX|nr:hypothetical protein CEXT_83491 [Caerostris extrusa]